MSNENLDDILDETLDDLADLPSSKPFAPGAHAVTFSLQRQKDKPSTYIAKFVHKEVLELANANTDEADIPKSGDEATIFIHTKKKDGTPNEFGQGQLKALCVPFVEMVGSNKMSDLLNVLGKGVDAAIVSGVKKSKDPQYQDAMVVNDIKPL